MPVTESAASLVRENAVPARFSTAELQPGSRLAALRTWLDEVALPGELHAAAPRARVDRIGTGGDWEVTRIVTAPLAVIHAPNHVAAGPGGYLLWLQLRGEAVFRQGSRTVAARTGCIVVRSADLPSEVTVTRRTCGILVRAPRAATSLPLGHVVTLDADNGSCAVIRQFLRGLATSGVSANAVLEQAHGTLAGLLHDGLSASLRENTCGRAQPILARIEARLSDPGLDASQIAAEMGISLRTLHRSLAAAGVSFRRYLLQQRLFRCQRDLVRCPHESVTTICLRWGFSDLSYFCRVFRRHTGMTPSQARR
ncbi:AraC family transcriptional regulator [Arhodomonas sp. SL1]|uniref:AraC family transcriptional regulator n=1 Tax=Arhodomonas sp. SL1 TaxID=3425691 RepID=UPI003F88349B